MHFQSLLELNVVKRFRVGLVVLLLIDDHLLFLQLLAKPEILIPYKTVKSGHLLQGSLLCLHLWNVRMIFVDIWTFDGLK